MYKLMLRHHVFDTTNPYDACVENARTSTGLFQLPSSSMPYSARGGRMIAFTNSSYLQRARARACVLGESLAASS